MASVTAAIAGTGDTSNASSYDSAAFTPAASDLIVALVDVASTSGPSMQGFGNSLTFSRIPAADWLSATSVVTGWIFVANQLVGPSPVSMTVRLNVSGGGATGADIAVARVAGMSKVGTAAVRQAAHTDNTANGTTPNIVFPGACLTTNPILVALSNALNPANVTPPTNFTEGGDTGFATPTHGFEWAYRNSGHTSATVTWGGAAGTQWGAGGVELDASASISGVFGIPMA